MNRALERPVYIAGVAETPLGEVWDQTRAVDGWRSPRARRWPRPA